MRKRAFALIFFVWAFITIVSPTLVQWSIAAAQVQQASTDIYENPGDQGLVKARRMLVLFDKVNSQKFSAAPFPLTPDSVVQAPAPSPGEQSSDHKAEIQQSTELMAKVIRILRETDDDIVNSPKVLDAL